MKIFFLIILILLGSCSQSAVSVYRSDTVEMLSLKGRLIQVEHKKEISRGILNVALQDDADIKGNTFILFDYCRDSSVEWKLLTMMPDEESKTGWSYVLNHFVNKQEDGKWSTKEVSRGEIKQKIQTYGQLKTVGLNFFKPGLFSCVVPKRKCYSNDNCFDVM